MTKISVIFVLLVVPSLVFSVPVFSVRNTLNTTHLDSFGLNVLCDVCDYMVEGIRKLFELHVAEELIADATVKMCELMKIEDKYICSKIVPEFKDEVLYIFAHTALSSREICGRILGDKCEDTYDPFNQTWVLPVPGGKPPVKPYPPSPKPGSPVNRILHITDIHWDPQYTEGLTTQCGEPLCCRPPNPKANVSKDAAGPWGDYHCDIPYRTVVNLMEHLNASLDQFDWVYMTGDLPAHNDWTQTRVNQLSVLTNITKLFKEYLPGKPIFFAMGNHESSPVNSFPPPYITGEQSESWLYDKAAEVWSDWLTPDAAKTLKYGGYYAVDVKPDLKVISLQTNYCSKNNWWLLINSTDPADMLKWLGNELLESEKKGQKVHILGHIPNNDKPCMKSWSYAFHSMALRFENIITGYFYGHIHTDKFHVFYDEEDKSYRPFGVAYMAPSVTGYGFHTAAYRLYDIDGTYTNSTRTTLDHYTYIMNITDANLTNKPKWLLEYSAKDAFGLKSLSPDSWNNLIVRFEKDDKLFQTFYYYASKSSQTNECHDGCKSDLLCLLRRDRSYDNCDHRPNSSKSTLRENPYHHWFPYFGSQC